MRQTPPSPPDPPPCQHLKLLRGFSTGRAGAPGVLPLPGQRAAPSTWGSAGAQRRGHGVKAQCLFFLHRPYLRLTPHQFDPAHPALLGWGNSRAPACQDPPRSPQDELPKEPRSP